MAYITDRPRLLDDFLRMVFERWKMFPFDRWKRETLVERIRRRRELCMQGPERFPELSPLSSGKTQSRKDADLLTADCIILLLCTYTKWAFFSPSSMYKHSFSERKKKVIFVEHCRILSPVYRTPRFEAATFHILFETGTGLPFPPLLIRTGLFVSSEQSCLFFQFIVPNNRKKLNFYFNQHSHTYIYTHT